MFHIWKEQRGTEGGDINVHAVNYMYTVLGALLQWSLIYCTAV